MLTHSEHASVQQQVCAALSELPYNNAGKRLKSSKIAEPGGIEAVVAAMRRTSSCRNSHVRRPLSNLAVKAANQVKIAESGGIEALAAAMKIHKSSVLVQEQACWVLRNLNQVKIAEAGGIEAVVAAMEAQKGPRSSNTRVRCCGSSHIATTSSR